MLEIYHCDISGLSDEEFLKMYLSSDEERQKKADKIKSNPAKKLSLAAGELTKRVIAEKLNKDPKDLRFRVGKNGKPYIENVDIEFSIAHSGDIAICAVSDRPVGVDIEKIRDVNIGVAKRLFTHDEQQYVFEKWNYVRVRFFEIWTRKEAYVKMRGRGVLDFPNFSTMGNKKIETHIRKKYIVSVANDRDD